MTQPNIFLLNLKLDKLEFLLDFLKSSICFNKACWIHNFHRHYALHHLVKMDYFFILCKPTVSVIRIWNQQPPFLLYFLFNTLVEVGHPINNHLSHLGKGSSNISMGRNIDMLALWFLTSLFRQMQGGGKSSLPRWLSTETLTPLYVPFFFHCSSSSHIH